MNLIKRIIDKLRRKPLLVKPVVSGSFFKEIVILKADGVVLKTLQIIDHIPRTNNLMYVDGKQYQVTSNVFDYDLKCIKVWVASC
jgi:hypothetical protein